MIEENIKIQLVSDAVLILNSINFIGAEFEKLHAELDTVSEMEDEDLAREKLFKLAKQARNLSNKLTEEDRIIDKFFEKYKKYEKETILPDFSKIKQTLNRGFSENKKRQGGSGGIQKRPRKRS